MVNDAVSLYLRRVRETTRTLMEQHVDPIIARLEDQNLPADERTRLEEESRGIVRRYTAAFFPNFLVWLGQGLHAVGTAEAKHAFGENLEVEIQDKRGQHQSMLFDYAKSIGALPGPQDFLAIDPDIRNMRAHLQDFSPIKLTALAAALENASIDFIPRLEKLAGLVKPGADLTYTEAHGVADIAHAEQFANALSAEMGRMQLNKDGRLKQTGDHVKKLLERIFTPGQENIR